jgi:hypothetical protein
MVAAIEADAAELDDAQPATLRPVLRPELLERHLTVSQTLELELAGLRHAIVEQ